MNEQPRRSNIWRLVGSVVVLLVALGIFLFRQPISDFYAVWRYKPSPTIASLADAASLTDKGRFYLYASAPEINDREAFNNHCTNRGEKTAILGCYVSGRIYIFNVTDERLQGIKEVTTAHEMLHAAYERLSDAERQRLSGLVEAQLASITDTRIKELVALYDKTEPGERANELHSILGTEVDKLSPELEDYYRQYFIDRQAVVSLSKRYESVFAEINEEQNRLVADLNQLSGEIETRSDSYNADTARLNSDIAAFNRKANNGDFATQEEFDAARAVLVARQNALQDARNELNAMIATYNEKRKRLEELNGQAEELNRSINSALSPVPSL